MALQIFQISISSNGDWKESICHWNVLFTRLKFIEWRTAFTGDFGKNAKICGVIKKYFRFLLLIVQFCWCSSNMVHTIVSTISMIWKIFSLKKVLQSLVYSFLVKVLIYIYFYSSIAVFKSKLGFCHGFAENFQCSSFSSFFHHTVIVSLVTYNCQVYGKL